MSIFRWWMDKRSWARGIGAAGLSAVLLALASAPSLAGRDSFEGLAIVRDDGSLLIKNRVVVLYGIYLPPTDNQCRDWSTPVRCNPRGVLALDFKVKGFITCFPRGEDSEGRVHAICYVDRTSFDPGEDLGAYLIQRGWALALPNAPFEYHAMERIALARGLGVWGFYADSFSNPARR
jgi:endonuclease YncB( thermonuclease family)